MTETISTSTLSRWFDRAADALTAEADLLTELDSAIGDADHGTNMTRGFDAVRESVLTSAPADVQGLLKAVGMTLVTKVGGASGSLYGTFFLDMSRNTPATGEIRAGELETALQAGLAGVIGRGHAHVGDKTMVDALEPAINAFSLALARGIDVAEASRAAASAAREGRDSTGPLLARKGRASYLGDRSVGHVDPGSASATILLTALSETLQGEPS